MSQYESRMHIVVSTPEVWKKLHNLDVEKYGIFAPADEVFDLAGTEWEVSDWSCIEKDLKNFVSEVAEAIGKDGIVFADTTNINVDPYAYIVYAAGNGVREKEYGFDEFCFETDISDLPEYLSYKNHFAFNEKELKVLKYFGIERVKSGKKFIFKRILLNEGLGDEVSLTDTRFEGRTERIEKVKVGDSVSLVHISGDKANPNCVDVLWNGETVGLLEPDAADIMAPILDKGDKEYTATVYSVTPLSKRSKRCQTALISIHIQFKVEPIELDDVDDKKEKTSAKKGDTKKSVGGSSDVVFGYDRIDEIGSDYYEGIYDGKDFVINPDATVTTTVNGTEFTVKIQTEKKMKSLCKKFKKAFDGKEIGRPLYDPLDAMDGKLEECGFGEYNQSIYEVSDDAEELSLDQIKHRTAIYVKMNNLMQDESAAAQIIEVVPKKKNGMLYNKRVTQVCSLFCMEKDATMYTLCAVAKSDTSLVVEVRQIASNDMEKIETDVATSSNLFR